MDLGLLAQAAESDAARVLGGESGWVGAGLLGLVLSWLLFKHLPDKDKQLEKFIESKDTQSRDMLLEYKASLKQVTDHCSEELAAIAETFRRENDRILDRLGDR